MKILIASNNKHKKEEFRRMLSPIGIEIVTAADEGLTLKEVIEDGNTFIENARKKASEICCDTGMICMADDSGLCVDALDGAPGVYSARYSGGHGNDDDNIDKLLNELKDVPEKERTAAFVCSICCVFPDGRKISVEGRCPGKILFERQGCNGFGYDPVFAVNGKSFAVMSAEEKDAVSHRGIALKKLFDELSDII